MQSLPSSTAKSRDVVPALSNQRLFAVGVDEPDVLDRAKEEQSRFHECRAAGLCLDGAIGRF
jgi:hypothetical protein